MTDAGSGAPPAPLQGVRVLVTRPAPQADGLCRLIEAEGGTALRLPLIAIEPTARAAEAQQRLAGAHDLWIFTSANAVRHALQLAPAAWPSHIAAIGPATAAALSGAGHDARFTPLTEASSEALLALPDLAQVAGRRVLVVTGEGGRDELERGLAQRGAGVERAEVYRRVPLPYPPEAVSEAVRRSHVVVVTSAGILERLWVLIPEEARRPLLRKPLVAPAARVVEKARELGFTRPRPVTGPMSDAALCAACAAAVAPTDPKE